MAYFNCCINNLVNIILIFECTYWIWVLKVEEVVSKFKSLHKKLEVRPSSASHDNLITYCCDLQKVCIHSKSVITIFSNLIMKLFSN